MCWDCIIPEGQQKELLLQRKVSEEQYMEQDLEWLLLVLNQDPLLGLSLVKQQAVLGVGIATSCAGTGPTLLT